MTCRLNMKRWIAMLCVIAMVLSFAPAARAYENAETTPNLKVSGGSEILGFVPLSEINAPVSCTHLIAYAKEDKVNLRSRGDKTGDIIGRVRLGERLRVSDYGLQWTQVVTPEGKKGYIKTDLLTFE